MFQRFIRRNILSSFCRSSYKTIAIRGSSSLPTCLSSSLSSWTNNNVERLEIDNHCFSSRRNFWESIFSSNPITKLISAETSTDPSTETSGELFERVDFSRITASHLIRAAFEVQVGYDKNWRDLKPALKELSPEGLLAGLNKLEAGGRVLQNIASLCYQTHCFDDSWINAVKKVPNSWIHERSEEVYLALVVALSKVSDKEKKLAYLLQKRLDSYKKRGAHLEDGVRNVLLTLDDKRLKLETTFISPEELNPVESGPSTKDKLQAMYTIASIRQKEAEILGYKAYVDFVFNDRMISNPVDIQTLHNKIAGHASNALSRNDDKNPISSNKLDLSPYLSSDGILQGLFAINRALFGLIVSEDENPCGWHPDVRLFHVMTEDKKRIGSFYIDIFKRSTKTRAVLMGPLTSSIVYINMNINPPTWDDMPTPVSLEDTVSLFHEFGHVLQFLLADKHHPWYGSSGDSNLLDISEVLPHFMEHWVFETSILQTLAHLSGTSIPDDTIKAVQEQRRRDKAEESLRRIFLGQLELELFSRNKQEGESLVGLQRRIGETYVPHDLLPKSDLSPMCELMESNGFKQIPIAQYRYLLSEVISAEFFKKFKNAGISNQENMRELGTSFKKIILDPGTNVDMRDALKVFCGSQPLSSKSFRQLYHMD
mmetsp:Transcript_35545/g.40488  ORF Transcript_35545/g.40488 Transcript_35545/m.40488 type:complete len:655 (-) Transcript_35545:115-2079(-)|eukprot:CAMPEP_0194190318 /NCGR_PEP_ID=MMETSP0154-20130528/62558_1 /TAXON_ID=1049557 /ORGANISM="Thalassiothrix antarctica, Strain L6-D1" /LENGTH=654 /DNA_ID=CAMNT_0038912173 /DNA_START=90 /DNA_END=2054 /DNA_ORIENTATION=+